jgi:hypothetical protein
MLATILFPIPLAVLPIVPLPQPTRDCWLEVLTPQAIEERALTEFGTKVHEYVGLHRRFVRSMGTAAMFDDEGGFLGDELRTVIAAARPQARQGDFFTPSVSVVFRARIDRALLRGVGGTPNRLYEPLPGEPSPAVNSEFPYISGSVAWPGLFLELPELPSELGYALWGRDLVLLDGTARLVLDVLPDALPDGAHPGVLYQ